ncbi:hypothetical protein F2Q69_00023293 [Brassica cretica]|uniref:Uncharacterized protein n=1 Tax=Brassica cretica TaxID=69181 RepID=A0A8S9QA38_BRACR|nr:hypothetical protein F2Q69_00023293 [Brassica cretica]
MGAEEAQNSIRYLPKKFTPASRPASTHQYISSSSGNIRAPGTTVSKMPTEAQSFSVFGKKFRVWLRPEWNPGSQDYWSDVLPKGSLLRMSNSGYSPSSMTKSSNKGQTVGEKYSGIKFLQAQGRTPTSGSPLRETPVPCYGVLRVRSLGPPVTPSNRPKYRSTHRPTIKQEQYRWTTHTKGWS